jgi:hypothetical protein
MSAPSVSLLAWGYNEQGLLPAFFERATAALERATPDHEIVFVNDGSADATGAIADEAARRDPRIRVLHNERNLNIGASFLRALGEARKERVMWQTVDWAFDLHHLPLFLELSRRFDVVVGVRPVPVRLLSHVPLLRSLYRVRSRSDSLGKALVSLGNYYTVRLLFGVPFHDFQSLMLFPREVLQSMPLHGRTSFLGPEMLVRAHALGLRFIEVPVRFQKREQGTAKGTKPMTVVRAVGDTFSNWLRWGLALRRGRRPSPRRQIHRVMEPWTLDEDTIRLVAPLFREFKPPE